MQIVQEMFDSFKNKENLIDIQKLKDFVFKDKEIVTNCSIFVKKVQMLSQSTMNQTQFKQYFDQNLENDNHFNAVFDSLDKQNLGFISKASLRQLLRKQNLEQNLDEMIEVCTQNIDKITKEELRKFLKEK